MTRTNAAFTVAVRKARSSLCHLGRAFTRSIAAVRSFLRTLRQPPDNGKEM